MPTMIYNLLILLGVAALLTECSLSFQINPIQRNSYQLQSIRNNSNHKKYDIPMHFVLHSPIPSSPYSSALKTTNYHGENPSTAMINPASKFFNLEEMEDKEACTTEIFLSQDGSVTLTETNGPPPVASHGRWNIIDDSNSGKRFEMTVTRTYSSGRDHSDVGEFQFDVERTFIGDLSYVGSLVSVEGSMHMQDEFRGGDVEVGFFSMIDTTDEKLGEEGY